MNRKKANQSHRQRRSRFETLERRNLLAGDVGTNFVEAEDVNLDGMVTGLDALNVINEMVVRQNHDGVEMAGRRAPFLTDVNSSGDVTAGDALQIINQLARPRRTAADLEAGVDHLARVILREELPEGIDRQAADRWLASLENRIEVSPDRQGPFNRLDGNNDGEITADEVREEIWERISEVDSDDSDSISREELRASRPSERDVERPIPDATNAFERLDENSDGSLTEDEVSEQRWDRLSQADADGDGGVTLEEIEAARAEREDRVQRPEPGDRFASLDLNEDGQLTEDELSEEAWTRLSQADSNSDGGVTMEEIQAARAVREDGVQRPNPADRFRRLDLNDDGQLTEDELSEEAWARISRADINEDGGVTIQELRAARAEREDGVQRPEPGEWFVRLDLNDDGQLTEDEVSEEAWERLSQADTNADGGVTLEEIRAARAEREDGVQRPGPGQWFDRLDLNDDGQLTEDEVSEEAWERLSQADANDDGGVTLAEIQAHREANESNMQGPLANLSLRAFRQLDVNDDGALSSEEVSQRAWQRLSQADRNGDNLVTFVEIKTHRRENGGGSAGNGPGTE